MIYQKYKYINKYYNFNIKLNYDFKNMKKLKKCYTCYGKCYCDCTLKTIVSSDGPQSPPWKAYIPLFLSKFELTIHSRVSYLEKMY
jgi:hypothetical protein